MNKRRTSEVIFALLMMLPVLILFFVTNLYPVVYAILISFEARSPFDLTGVWVGLHNYDVVLHSADFWKSTLRGFIYGFGSVAVQVIVGLFTALIVREQFRGKLFVTTLVLVPYIVPPFAAMLVMKWLFNDLYGVVNYFLLSLHLIPNYISFFGDSSRAMPTVIIATSWQYSMFVCMLVLARMMTINRNLYEMAAVMGASAWRKFRDVTLPSIKGVLLLAILLRSIWMFNKFDIVWLLTQGGPLSATTTLPILTYVKAFQGFQFGIGAAISTLAFGILSVFSVVYFVAFKPEKEVSV